MPRFTDNFNRSDGGLGSNWTALTGSWTIVSNQIRCNTASAENFYRVSNGASYANDQDALLTRAVVGQPAYQFQGVSIRCATSGHTCYFAYIDSFGGWYFGLFNGGSYTEIGSGSNAPSAGDIYMIDAVGTTIRFRRDRGGTITTLSSGTNSTLTSGYPGIAGYDYSAAWSPMGYSDDFDGGDNVTASASIPPIRAGKQMYTSILTW